MSNEYSTTTSDDLILSHANKFEMVNPLFHAQQHVHSTLRRSTHTFNAMSAPGDSQEPALPGWYVSGPEQARLSFSDEVEPGDLFFSDEGRPRNFTRSPTPPVFFGAPPHEGYLDRARPSRYLPSSPSPPGDFTPPSPPVFHRTPAPTPETQIPVVRREEPDESPGEEPKDEDEDGEICGICREGFTQRVITPCGHEYCQSCVGRWLQANFTCPTCRQRLFSYQLRPVVEANTDEEPRIRFYGQPSQQEHPELQQQIYQMLVEPPQGQQFRAQLRDLLDRVQQLRSRVQEHQIQQEHDMDAIAARMQATRERNLQLVRQWHDRIPSTRTANSASRTTEHTTVHRSRGAINRVRTV
jgi:hypothetical protein